GGGQEAQEEGQYIPPHAPFPFSFQEISFFVGVCLSAGKTSSEPDVCLVRTVGTCDVLWPWTTSLTYFCFASSSFLPVDLSSSLVCFFFAGGCEGQGDVAPDIRSVLVHARLPEGILEDMGFGALLCVLPFWTDSALLQALKDLWDRRWNAFVLPWG